MKKIVLIVTFLTFIIFFSQETKEFTETNEFYLTEIDSLTKKKYWDKFPNVTDTISIFLKNRKGEKLHKFNIQELEFYDGTIVEVMNTKKLKNVIQIIHVQSDYNTCCSNYYSNYFLKTKKGKIIKLPETEYLHCDGPTPIIEYRFPNQKFGIKNKILLTKSILNAKYEVLSIEIQKIYNWNGKIFELEK